MGPAGIHENIMHENIMLGQQVVPAPRKHQTSLSAYAAKPLVTLPENAKIMCRPNNDVAMRQVAREGRVQLQTTGTPLHRAQIALMIVAGKWTPFMTSPLTPKPKPTWNPRSSILACGKGGLFPCNLFPILINPTLIIDNKSRALKILMSILKGVLLLKGARP